MTFETTWSWSSHNRKVSSSREPSLAARCARFLWLVALSSTTTVVIELWHTRSMKSRKLNRLSTSFLHILHNEDSDFSNDNPSSSLMFCTSLECSNNWLNTSSAAFRSSTYSFAKWSSDSVFKGNIFGVVWGKLNALNHIYRFRRYIPTPTSTITANTNVVWCKVQTQDWRLTKSSRWRIILKHGLDPVLHSISNRINKKARL